MSHNYAVYDIEDSGEILEEFEAVDMADAQELAEQKIKAFWQGAVDSEGTTLFVHYGVVEIEGDAPAPDSISEFDEPPDMPDITQAIHPELECTAAAHDWDELNVVGSGGGVCTTSRCTECNGKLIINTWVTDRFDGSEGHRRETVYPESAANWPTDDDVLDEPREGDD